MGGWVWGGRWADRQAVSIWLMHRWSSLWTRQPLRCAALRWSPTLHFNLSLLRRWALPPPPPPIPPPHTHRQHGLQPLQPRRSPHQLEMARHHRGGGDGRAAGSSRCLPPRHLRGQSGDEACGGGTSGRVGSGGRGRGWRVEGGGEAEVRMGGGGEGGGREGEREGEGRGRPLRCSATACACSLNGSLACMHAGIDPPPPPLQQCKRHLCSCGMASAPGGVIAAVAPPTELPPTGDCSAAGVFSLAPSP